MKIASIEERKGNYEGNDYHNVVFYGLTDRNCSETADYKKIHWENIKGDYIVEQYVIKYAYIQQMMLDLKMKGIEDFLGKNVKRIMYDSNKKPCFMILG